MNARRTATKPARQRVMPQAAPIQTLSELVRDPEMLVGSADVVRLRLAPSYKTLIRWIALDKFPRPLNLGDRYLTWRGKVLLAWLDQREAESLAAPERPGQTRKRQIDQRKQRQAMGLE